MAIRGFAPAARRGAASLGAPRAEARPRSPAPARALAPRRSRRLRARTVSLRARGSDGPRRPGPSAGPGRGHGHEASSGNGSARPTADRSAGRWHPAGDEQSPCRLESAPPGTNLRAWSPEPRRAAGRWSCRFGPAVARGERCGAPPRAPCARSSGRGRPTPALAAHSPRATLRCPAPSGRPCPSPERARSRPARRSLWRATQSESSCSSRPVCHRPGRIDQAVGRAEPVSDDPRAVDLGPRHRAGRAPRPSLPRGAQREPCCARSRRCTPSARELAPGWPSRASFCSRPGRCACQRLGQNADCHDIAGPFLIQAHRDFRETSMAFSRARSAGKALVGHTREPRNNKSRRPVLAEPEAVRAIVSGRVRKLGSARSAFARGRSRRSPRRPCPTHCHEGPAHPAPARLRAALRLARPDRDRGSRLLYGGGVTGPRLHRSAPGRRVARDARGRGRSATC